MNTQVIPHQDAPDTKHTKKPIQIEGRVVSNKMDRTIVVVCEWQRPHPRYGKVTRYQTRYYAHDPENTCAIGDLVVLLQCRPLSKKKRWVLASIKERAAGA